MEKRRRGEKPSEGLYRPFKNAGKFLIVFFFRRKLAGIVAKLGPLAEQHGLLKFLNNVDHANILNGFSQELAYAVTDYQVCDAHSIAGTV